jgi:hypothetical protein
MWRRPAADRDGNGVISVIRPAARRGGLAGFRIVAASETWRLVRCLAAATQALIAAILTTPLIYRILTKFSQQNCLGRLRLSRHFADATDGGQHVLVAESFH